MAEEFDFKEELGEKESPGEETTVEEEAVVEEETIDEEKEEEEASEESEEESEEEVVEEEEVDEVTSLKEQNESLLKTIEEMAEGKLQPKAKVEEAAATEVSEEVKEVLEDFIGPDEDLEEILEDRGKLNKLLLKVAKAGKVDEAKLEAKIAEKILQNVPRVVMAQVQQQMVLKKTVDDFMNVHKNLQPVKRTVGLIATQIAGENPEWSFEKVLEETANKAYEVLKIKRSVLEPEKKKGGDPSFVESKASRKSGKGDMKSKLQKDIDELLDLR